MSDLVSTEDPVVRFAKLYAEQYYFLAKEMMERLGEREGREAILSAVAQFGRARVEAIQREAVSRGMDPAAPETFAELRDMPRTGWESSPDDPSEKTYCPMEHVWSLYGDRGRELGYLYCQIDHVLYQGFGMDLERPLCRAKGDAVCRFILSPSERTSLQS
jgi:hypothetical protein